MEKISGWIERLLLLKLNEITGEIKTIHTRIDSVEKDVAGLWRAVSYTHLTLPTNREV